MRFILAVLLSMVLPCLSTAKELAGKVVAVTDGDTVTLLVECANLEVPVRLSGIDAPESGQRYGKKSAQSLRALVGGKAVTLIYHKRDKYGRLVGMVLESGRDINLAQVESGHAWHFKEYQNEQSHADRERYAVAELAASAARLGLWRDKAPTPPWEWRDTHPMEVDEGPASSDSAQLDPDAEFSFATFGGEVVHIGPRGGRYIVLPNGKRRYLSQEE